MIAVSIVGMAGSGKSEVSRVFEVNDFTRIRFGDLTDEGMAQRGLTPNEANERQVRELLRKEHGMAAYAKLNLVRIDEASKTSNVVVDGLYSWEEYTLLKNYYGDKFYVVAVWSSPVTRYSRLVKRVNRPLSLKDAINRDGAEIEKVNKGGPIAMADFTIINEAGMAELRKEVRNIIAGLK